MSGFWNSLRAELWASWQRKNLRISLWLIVLAVFARVLWAYVSLNINDGGFDELAANHQNFWPRFGQAASFGLTLVELSCIVIIGGAMPREISLGVARDPLCRNISRSAFVLSRALVACLLPILLAVVAVSAAAGSSALFFDAGNVVTDPILLDDDPEGKAAFSDWLVANDLRADQVAAALDADLDYQIPDEHYPFVPILLVAEEEISHGILFALLNALLPLVALGIFAFALSLLFPTGSLASGVTLGSVLLFGVLLAPELGEKAWWCFADWLPGMGKDSALKMASYFADGYTDQPPIPAAAVKTGRWGSLIALVLLALAANTSFKAKRL